MNYNFGNYFFRRYVHGISLFNSFFIIKYSSKVNKEITLKEMEEFEITFNSQPMIEEDIVKIIENDSL